MTPHRGASWRGGPLARAALLGLALACLPLAAPAHAKGRPVATLDLWRAAPGASKVYVMVGLPDGSERLFLVDSGAAVNVIHRDVLEELGIGTTTRGGEISGLSGSVPWVEAVVPRVTLGDVPLEDVRFAVDVPGTPERSGPLRVAGILGSDVLSRFTVVVDDPRDRLELWAPNTWVAPRGTRSAPLLMTEGHPRSVVQVHTRLADGTRGPVADVVVDVDTGATDLLLIGGGAGPLATAATRGLEPIYGIGADLDDVPPENFLTETGRVRVSEILLGGTPATVPDELRARWMYPDAPVQPRGGLLGYETWLGKRLVLDYPGQRVALLRAGWGTRRFDAVREMLRRHEARWSATPVTARTPRDAVDLAMLYAASDRLPEAVRVLQDAHAAAPQDAELASTLARLHLSEGRPADALLAMLPVPAAALAEEHVWTTHVALLARERSPKDALAAAEGAAVQVDAATSPGARAQLLVAWSDALLANGRPREASAALRRAAAVGGSAHLLRSARVALVEGDHDGAMAALRHLTRLYPLDGTATWMRARLARPEERAGVLADVERAIARLHPEHVPYDFVGAAMRLLGDPARGAAMLAKGRARDCVDLAPAASHNCVAWYDGLAGERLDAAGVHAAAAIRAEPRNAGFLDTASMVAAVRGDVVSALAHASAAVALRPDDPYLLWQFDVLEGRLPSRVGP